ncbi:MAG TPA: MFS transporter [Gaiellales bacterium]|nr:MFS transporter [Gaiellales bacterium]
MTEDSLTTRATRIWAVALTGGSLFMITLDNLIVLSTLPSMQRDLGVSIDRLQWVVDAYILSFAVLMLTGAALGDRYGRRRMLVMGLLLFTASSAAGALSHDLTQLVIARAVQGIGAALLMPMTLTLLSAAFPPERRTAALGLWSSIAGLGVALGPLLGGLIVETLDWHWIFWINVPVGLAAAALAPRRLAESRGAQVPLDLRGLTLASGGLLGIVWATTRGNADGWTSSSTLAAYAIGAALLGAFVVQERRSAAPMLPLGLFRRPGFAAANGAGFGLHFTMFAAFFLIIQYLTQVHGDTALRAGVETLPWTLLPLVVSPFTGAFGGRIGHRPMIVAGLLLLSGGTAGAAFAMGLGANYSALVAPLVAIGLGIALVLPNVASAALGSALPEHIGKASGTNSTFRQLGGAFGIAIAVLVFDRAGSYASPGAVVDGVRAALFVAAAVGALGAVAALGIPARASKQPAIARPARAVHSAS